MKRFLSMVFFALGAASSVMAAQPDYVVYGQVTGPSNIDAVSFVNYGTFAFTNSDVNTNLGTPGASVFAQALIPFATKDTLYYTNTGLIDIVPGMRFATDTSGTGHNAGQLENSGTIIGVDTPVNLLSFNLNSLAPLQTIQPSIVQVLATNIINDGGTIEVGNAGLLQLTGSNIDLSNGGLAAGTVSEVDTNDTTGREASEGNLYFLDLFDLGYVNPPDVYELFWGVDTFFNVSIINDPNASGKYGISFTDADLFFTGFTTRNNQGGFNQFQNPYPSNYFGNLTAFSYQSPIFNISNIDFYNVNIVLVNTNLADTNLSVQVGFNNLASSNGLIFFSEDTFEDIVQVSEQVPDVLTGLTVTNSIYILDTGAADLNTLATNEASVDGFSRPSCFEIATSEPAEWSNSVPANIVVDPTTSGFFDYNDAIYRAQVGRNPEVLDGTFTTWQTNFATVPFYDIPDPTNEAGRLEISGNNVNLTEARIRGNGVATLTAANLSGSPRAKEWGNINADLNVTNGLMTVSNIFPLNFQRVRGVMTMWGANGYVTNIFGGATNVITYHVLFVDPNVRGTFRSSTRNLALRATNTTVIQDSLRVIGNSLLTSSNIDIQADVELTQGAGSWFPTNVPKLKNLLIDTNGSLVADNIIDVGFNMSVGHTSPLRRKYTVPSATNLGFVMATAPLFQAANFESDGTIIASNGGSMIIESSNLGLGLGLNNSNYLIADQNITLSAQSIGFTNSQIIAGGTNAAGRGLLLLESTADGQITDFASGLAATSTYLTNVWQVSDGFSLPVKPATGDLFGTEIITIATNFTVALHTWAGVDFGASSDGFSDNMVIGHLKLSRQSAGASLHFTGAGSQNGLYVDYLELDPNSLSYTDYRNGLIIDSNLTIYFAACNVDPLKLEAVYTNRLVWVPSFAGPNSTVAVPLLGSSNVCLMNVNLADSTSIGFFGTTPNADNQPYVLNDPSNPTNTYPCPSDSTDFRDYLVPTGSTNVVRVELSVSGKGTITPVIKPTHMTLGKSYTLTATPAAGWVFSQWSANGLPGGVDLTAKTITFQLQNNLLLTADFSPRAFTLVKGTYYGLFQPTNEVTLTNSGWFTVVVGANGSFSGKLLLAGIPYGFNGVFSTNGSATVTAKHGNNSVAVALQLDMSGTSGQVTGYVGSSANVLTGNVGAGWTSGNVSPYVGRYTMVLTNSASNAPAGYGYGAVSVSKFGVLSVAGKLADGPAFSQTTPVSKDGLWPFYAYVGKSGDLLVGWIAFQAQSGHSANLLGTNIVWNKAASSQAGPYEAGFSNSVQVLGSAYANPGHFSSGLSLETPVVILSGAGMAPVTNAVTDTGHAIFETNNLSLTINPVVGTFNGLIKHSGSPSTRMSGVVLQNQNGAYGFYLGTDNQSDAVLLQSK